MVRLYNRILNKSFRLMKMVYNWLVAAPTSVNTLKTTESGGGGTGYGKSGGKERSQRREGPSPHTVTSKSHTRTEIARARRQGSEIFGLLEGKTPPRRVLCPVNYSSKVEGKKDILRQTKKSSSCEGLRGPRALTPTLPSTLARDRGASRESPETGAWGQPARPRGTEESPGPWGLGTAMSRGGS